MLKPDEALQARNQKMVQEAIVRLGEKYLCHPKNFVTKKSHKKYLKQVTKSVK